MQVELIRAYGPDADTFAAMQREAFLPLLLRYRDHMQSPANESPSRVAERLANPKSHNYFIVRGGQRVGGLGVYRKPAGRIRLNRLFVLPAHQNQGIAFAAMQALEALYGDAESWELDTIAQERGNCHLYEKMGYHWTGHMTIVNPRMVLVDYIKHVDRR